ncbi:hypothetical protein BDZ91DRAFT_714910 [Kalaharituber pfeilii]|nr:hypothetical protein BDZ91DRAFT_714910 [Kalaharituber pfeilii]
MGLGWNLSVSVFFSILIIVMSKVNAGVWLAQQTLEEGARVNFRGSYTCMYAVDGIIDRIGDDARITCGP